MALTVTSLKETQVGGLKLRVLTVTWDDSYPAGGEALSADALGVDPYIVIAEPSAGFVYQYDHSAAKLKAFFQTDPGDSGGANVALIEVDDVDLLDTVVTRILAIGV